MGTNQADQFDSDLEQWRFNPWYRLFEARHTDQTADSQQRDDA